MQTLEETELLSCSLHAPVLAWRRLGTPCGTGETPDSHWISAQRLVTSSKIPHICFFSLFFCKIPGFGGTCRFPGFTFSFCLLKPKGRGAVAPCQHFMGHVTILSLCPKAPQSLHFTCGWSRRCSLSQQKSHAHFNIEYKDKVSEGNVGFGERTGHMEVAIRTMRILWFLPKPVLVKDRGGRIGGLQVNR